MPPARTRRLTLYVDVDLLAQLDRAAAEARAPRAAVIREALALWVVREETRRARRERRAVAEDLAERERAHRAFLDRLWARHLGPPEAEPAPSSASTSAGSSSRASPPPT